MDASQPPPKPDKANVQCQGGAEGSKASGSRRDGTAERDLPGGFETYVAAARTSTDSAQQPGATPDITAADEHAVGPSLDTPSRLRRATGDVATALAAAAATARTCWAAGKEALSPRYLDSSDVLKAYGHWQQPDEESARTAYLKAHAHHGLYSWRDTKAMELKMFGQGHMLYFMFLKYMAVAFCCLSVVPGLVSTVIYATSSWFSESTTNLELVTLGNFGLQSTNEGASQLGLLFQSRTEISGYVSDIDLASFASSRSAEVEIAVGMLFRTDAAYPPAPLALGGGDKAAAITGIALLDMSCILIFFLFCLWFMLWNKKLAAKTDAGRVTIQRYAVRVRGVPRDVTPEELKEHFERYGEVARVDVAFSVYGLIDMVDTRWNLQSKVERDTARLQRAAELKPKVREALETSMLSHQLDLELVNRAIRRQQQVHGCNISVEAFVVFQEDISKAACLLDQPRTWLGRQLGYPPADQRLRSTFVLEIFDAPEPSDVIFENLECSKLKRFGLWLASWTVKLLLLLCGFVLVGVAPAIRNVLGQSKGGASVEHCDALCTYDGASGVPTLSDAYRNLYKTCHDTSATASGGSCSGAEICYQCYCRMVLNAGMLNEAAYCSEYAPI